jgi:hypothetical protein
MIKKLLPVLTLACAITACNNNPKSTTVADSVKIKTVTKIDTTINKTAVADTSDPDPTDTVPTSQYGVNTSSKKTA